jgi:hypothetical protein
MATPHVPTPYILLTLPAARRQLRQLQKRYTAEARDMSLGIMALAENPRPIGSRKLANRPEMRLRFGNYPSAVFD